MKTSTNKKELISLDACKKGLNTFVGTFGDNEATLSQCLTNNGWEDTWWLIEETYGQFSESQKRDLRLLACDYAESSLHHFESEYPNDKRPQLAIKAAKDFSTGLISIEKLAAAGAAAWAAAEAAGAAGAAAEAAWAAAEAAWAAARAAAWAAARAAAWSAAEAAWSAGAAMAAAMAANTKMLMELFKKWEGENESKDKHNNNEQGG